MRLRLVMNFLNMLAFLLPGLNSRGTGCLAPGLGPILQCSPSVADLSHSEETAPYCQRSHPYISENSHVLGSLQGKRDSTHI